MQESRIDRADLPPDPKALRTLTLGDLLRRYRAEVTPHKRSARHEQNRIDRLLRDPMAAVRLDLLNPGDLTRFRDQRLATVGPQAVRGYNQNITKSLILWCPWPDSNQHALAGNRF